MRKYLFNRSTWISDLVAGLTLGIESIPDGMASGLLAAVNPIHGVYAYMVGAITGAFFTSSVYMTVQATGAMSLIVASVPEVRRGDLAVDYLLALAILTGAIMVVLGLLKLGSLLRFVPKSVLTGFINAVAILIVLGQLGDLTGYAATGPNKVIQAINLFLNFGKVDPPSLAVGITSIILILVLEKTQLKSMGMVVALIVASLLPPLFQWESVTLAGHIAEIPAQLPRPIIPDLSTFLPMLIPALSLALVGLVQGAGISQTYANPDGKQPDASGDFFGQGMASIASGVFQGLPVAGSLSGTSLAVNSGARTRFANIAAGLTMAVGIVLFGGLIGKLAMPALAGLLIIVGFRTLKLDDVLMVWHTGVVQQLVALITFVLALFVPLQYAVLMGVALSILLFVLRQSNKIKIKEWVYEPGQLPVERDAPAELPANKIVILMPYGSLFFASANLFERQLPDIGEETRNAVVILNLRGRTDLGTTFMAVLRRYSEDLRKHDSRLILSGVSQHTTSELEKTGLITLFGRKNIFRATERVGESTLSAYAEADEWLQQISPSGTESTEPSM